MPVFLAICTHNLRGILPASTQARNQGVRPRGRRNPQDPPSQPSCIGRPVYRVRMTASVLAIHEIAWSYGLYCREYTNAVLIARFVATIMYAGLEAAISWTPELAQILDGRCLCVLLTAATALLHGISTVTILEAVWYKNGMRASCQLLLQGPGY